MEKHFVFGRKLSGTYTDRKGAYLIPIDGEKIGVIKTPKGYFLIGGGIENGETDKECILRECLEETGFSAEIHDFLCSAETYTEHSSIGLFHPIQNYYSGRLIKKLQPPKETDHELIWMSHDEIKGKMFSHMQDNAIDLFFETI